MPLKISRPVVLLAPAPELGLSGVSAYLGSLGPALARRGQEVILLRLRPGAENEVRSSRWEGYRRIHCTYRNVADAKSLVDGALSGAHPLALHSHDDSMLGLAAALSNQWRCRLVHTVHYVHPSTGTVLREHRPEVISVSAAVAEELETPSHVVRSFAEHRWTARRGLAERSEIARRRAHLGTDDQVVLFAGRANSPTKGADVLLGAAELLWADGATFHLVFAGPFWVGGRHKEIVERNADRVATIGVLSRPRLFAWYRAADVLVVPSRYEPFGLVALEAQTVGTPVVATATGGLVEVVNSSFGRLVPAEGEAVSPADLARAMTDVLSRKTDRASLGEWALTNFPEQPHVETLIRLYRA